MPTYLDSSGKGNYAPQPVEPMPLRIRFWHRIHLVVNGIAWRATLANREHDWSYASTPMKHPIWRLNNWLADRYVDEMIERYAYKIIVEKQ
jgi:hypothetical protein